MFTGNKTSGDGRRTPEAPSILQLFSTERRRSFNIEDGLTNGSRGARGNLQEYYQLPTAANTHHKRFDGYSRIFNFMFNAILVVLYVPLISFLQLMYQNETSSPFKTHGSFMIISVVSLTIAIFTSGPVLYMIDNLESQIEKRFFLIRYMIFKTVFCFSGIASPLSLLLVLFIRVDKYYWIGYSIICAIFGVVVVSNVFGYIKLRGNKDNGPLQMV